MNPVKLSRQRIVPVDTLPADASTYGPLVLYQKYPTLEDLPATVVNGQSWVVGGVEYLGRSVASLTSDTLEMLYLGSFDGERKISFFVSDVDASSENYFDILTICPEFTVRVLPNGNPYVEFVDTLGQHTYLIADNTLIAGVLCKIEFSIFPDSVSFTYAGVTKTAPYTNRPACIDADTVMQFRDDVSTRPLGICNIQQSLNGSLIDNIPCDESTGTELRNTVSPLRPATLSDEEAHADAWVPQAAITKTVWLYQKIARFTGQLQSIYADTRLFDQNLDFDIEFCIKDDTITQWEYILCDRKVLDDDTILKSLVFVRGSDTENLVMDIYGAGLWTMENALTFRGYTKYRIVRVGESFNLYINGKLFSTRTASLSTTINGSAVNLGGAVGSGYVGDISSLSVKSALGSLFWDFSKMTETEVPDSTGNGNTGIVNGVTVAYDWVPQC